ncbi:MAG: helicase-exonuclease AddAB subunit AddA [Ruminococcus sp.]|nr:helicase-exonuclease AddAB subunit AddA [Ruminococcus sp.]
MADVQWTPAQQDAIDARDGSVLVSAAAGSGKTAVLVERIIQAITSKENPISIDRMLIVTFTRAASNEMRSRIERALNELLKSDPYNSEILKQKQLLYNAKISTIDSFCTTFVRQYFYKLDIQSDFRSADDGELKILTEKALDNTLEFFYQQNDKDFISLVNAICSLKSDEKLREFITDTHGFLTSIPFADSRLEEMLDFYNIPFEETPYCKYIMRYASECINYCKELANSTFIYLDRDDFLKPEYIEKIRTVLKDDLNFLSIISENIENADWDMVKEAVSNKFTNFPRIKGSSDDPYKNTIMEIRDAYKKEVGSLSDLFFIDRAEIGAQTEKLYPIVNAFVNCVLRFREEFTALKNAKNILDFSDIEMLMVKLLCRKTDSGIELTDISEEISEQFDCVMVDEFQDINEVQDLIFRAICRDRENLFMVGDVKQSIYAFRQAKPDIFISYKNTYEQYDRNLNNYPAKIILDRNFRSRKGVTEACNFVFSTLMSAQVGGVDYSDGEELVYGAEYPDENRPAMELMMVNTSNLDKEHNEDALWREATAVAEKIHKMINVDKVHISDKNGQRPLTAGDIAILIRSPKSSSRAVTFVNALNERGILATSEDKKSFFDLSEIKVMLNMLRVIDNPLQDIPVLSVLMSPMFGFTADDMAEIRTHYRNKSIYLAVKAFADESAKCKAFIDFVDKMRTLSVTTTVDKLIGIIMQTLGYDAVIMAIRNAQAKNLHLLQKYARDFATNGYITLSSFINYIDRLQARGGVLKSGDDSGENLNAVKVMSIHASKGLEFPVCFVCCTSTKFNTDDVNQDIVIDAENGIGFRIKENLLKYDTVQRKAISLMMKDSFISEEMRILYVAMTRAKERLIITSTSDNPDRTVASIETKLTSYLISPFVVRNFNSFSEWIIACCLAHPSCDELRTNISADMSKYPDGNFIPWTVTTVGEKYVSEDNEQEADTVSAESSLKTAVIPLNEKFVQDFNERINYTYPNAPLTKLPQKVSASELAHKDNRIFNKILRKPQFLSDDKKSGAEKGTAFHAFMERCEINNALSDSRKEAERLSKSGFLTETQLEMLDYAKLDNFLKSKLIKRVLNAEEYHREYRFTVKINSSDFDSDIPAEFAENKIIMQGAVDLAFVEDGEVVIVDYKTDRVRDAYKLSEMYSKQVELYKQALEETMERRVKEVIIYSVYLGEQIKIDV